MHSWRWNILAYACFKLIMPVVNVIKHFCCTFIVPVRCSRSKLSDVAPSNKTRWLRPDKYDKNHSKAFPPIPKSVVKRFSKIAWSTVSKAALKGNLHFNKKITLNHRK